MSSELPRAERVLVLAPHPDDEAIGCGGTIARYVRRGTPADLIVFSDGEALDQRGAAADLTQERRSEIEASASILGFDRVLRLGLPDGGLSGLEAEIGAAVRNHVVTSKADLVLCPSPADHHQDHIAVARAALRSLSETPGCSLAFYEVYAPLRPTHLIDITEVLSIKQQAVLAYRRSLLGRPEFFWDAIRGLAVYRSALIREQGFFEALWHLRAPIADREILDWLTFGFRGRRDDEPTPFLLSGVDELLREITEARRCIAGLHDEVARRQHLIDSMSRTRTWRWRSALCRFLGRRGGS